MRSHTLDLAGFVEAGTAVVTAILGMDLAQARGDRTRIFVSAARPAILIADDQGASLVYQRIADFLEKNGAAAMITLRADGTPHAVRVGVTVVDGKIWSSAVEERARNRHLRRDPRSTLYLQDTQTPYGWLSLETKVTILDGPDAAGLNLRLFRVMQKRPAPAALSWFGRDMTEVEFLEAMRSEGRLVYEFEVGRAYGMTDASGAWSWRA